MSTLVALLALLVAFVTLGIQLVDRSTFEDDSMMRTYEFNQAKRQLAKSLVHLGAIGMFAFVVFTWSWFVYVRLERIEEMPIWLNALDALAGIGIVATIFDISWRLYALGVTLRESNQMTITQFIQTMRG
ncbi:hypothetical protein FHS27_004899 [Rhodopirellula rubra]|uniref:Uncharacterized protein n=1 Tax=Aporhodopirellula rubra TaxID=980271 RepID=A0A7W5H841_9BACT|nr:hypothetical protein [Aporhodopirellula rubra]MBB3209063.1 hypothetical protein [Aporhodopirellula rubra]